MPLVDLLRIDQQLGLRWAVANRKTAAYATGFISETKVKLLIRLLPCF